MAMYDENGKPKPGAWGKLGEAMAAPIRGIRDYQGVGRRLFSVQQMPQGTLPLYDKEAEAEPTRTFHSSGPRLRPFDPLW